MSPEFATPESASSSSEKQLRPHQHEMFGAILDSYYGDTARAYIDSATASGKDFVISRAVGHLLEDNPDLRMLYLCHNKFILSQAMQEMAEVTGSHHHGRMFGGVEEGHKQLLFGTFQTMTSERQDAGAPLYQTYDPKEFDIVVVNESHHGPAPTYRPVIEYYQPRLLLGATATAERRDEQDIGDIFGNPIYTLKLEEAIARGILARPDYHVLTDHVRRLDEFTGNLGDTKRKDIDNLNGMVFVPQRDEEIAQTIAEHMAQVEKPRTLIFCSSIGHTEHFSKLLPGKSAALHSDLHPDEQDKRLKAFRNGKIPTLLVVDMLNEGVDVPEINMVVFLRSTESKTVFFQQVGRGLRKTADKEEVRFLDFVANWDRLTTLQSLQTGIRDQRERLQARSRQPREISADISFNFSAEALEAVNIIQEARERERRIEARPPKRDKIAEARSELQSLLSLKPEEVPSLQLSKEEWEDFERRLGAGDKQAIGELATRCMLKAYLSAKKLAESNEIKKLATVEDLFQYALQEISQAAKDYDPEQKMSLSHNITQALSRKLKDRAREQAIIRLPGRFYESLERIETARAKIAKDLGSVAADEASPYLLTEYSGLEVEAIMQDQAFQYENMAPIEAAGQVGDETTDTLEVLSEDLRDVDVRDALEHLSYRERRVLELRYGIYAKEVQTLDEVGRVFNVTRERIRMIENQALKKLQQLPRLGERVLLGDDHPSYPQYIQNEALRERLAPASYRQARRIALYLGSQRRSSEEPLSPIREAIYYDALATLAADELHHRRGLHKPISKGWLFRYFQESSGDNLAFSYDDFLKGLDRLQQDGLAIGSWRRDPSGNVAEYVKLVNSASAVRSRLHKTIDESLLGYSFERPERVQPSQVMHRFFRN